MTGPTISGTPLRLLAITGDRDLGDRIKAFLPPSDFAVDVIADPTDAQALGTRRLQALLMDLAVGEPAIRTLLDRRPGLPILVLTSLADEATADTLLQAGATDIIMKDGLNDGRLQRGVRRAIARYQGASTRFGAAEALLRRLQLMQMLFSIVSRRDTTVDDQIRETLREGCRLFELDLGIVSRIQDTTYSVRYVHPPDGRVRSDETFDLQDTFCAITLEADGPLGIEHLRQSEWARHPCHETGLEAYIGLPIYVEHERYGTLNFSSTKPRRSPFPEIDLEFIRILGDWVSALLTRAHLLGELRVLATHDPLTGLPNRMGFLEYAEAVRQRARRDEDHYFALLFVDLDNFKIVNDTLGHVAGDEVLQQAASRLSSHTRPGDFVARFGGDEFVVLIDHVDRPQAEDVAARIGADLKRPFSIGAHKASTGGSIGIALSRGTEEIDELLFGADQLMYHAKRSAHTNGDEEVGQNLDSRF